jgi:hypothetical protein
MWARSLDPLDDAGVSHVQFYVGGNTSALTALRNRSAGVDVLMWVHRQPISTLCRLC